MNHGAAYFPVFDGLTSGIVPKYPHGGIPGKPFGPFRVAARQKSVGIAARPGRIMPEPALENRPPLGSVPVKRIYQIPFSLLNLRADCNRSAVQRYVSPAVVMHPRQAAGGLGRSAPGYRTRKVRLIQGRGDPENPGVGTADVRTQRHDEVPEKECRLEGVKPVALDLHRRTQHIARSEAAHMSGTVFPGLDGVVALQGRAVVVSRRPGNHPPVPMGEDIVVLPPVLHEQQRPVGREVGQSVLPVRKLEADRTVGVHADRRIPCGGTVDASVRTVVITRPTQSV